MNRLFRLRPRPKVLDGCLYRKYCWLRQENHPTSRCLQLCLQYKYSGEFLRYTGATNPIKCQHTMPPQQKQKSVLVRPGMTLRQLALQMDVDPISVADFVIDLGEELENGLSTVVTPDLAELLLLEHSMEPIYPDTMETVQSTKMSASLLPRPPVVTVMGHVDHGKTTLLDSLRKTSVAAKEAGGITQHIGAFSVPVGEEKKTITFIDTPGHAAFENMRARGANITDVVVLVVAADDGVKPQTVESIKHATKAGVPIIVAINKVDKSRANVEKTKQQLLQHGIQLEEFGGDIQSVEISALKATNLDGLLEAIITLAELQDLKANKDGRAQGVVLEARKDRHNGIIATILVKRGHLKKGSVIQTELACGKVRMMFNDRGEAVSKATPATPVEVTGWKDLPLPGDEVFEVKCQEEAYEYVRRRQARLIDQERKKKEFLEQGEYFNEREVGKIYESANKLNIVIKGDVNGSVEAICDALKTYRSRKVKLNLLTADVGAVNETDLRFAKTFKGIVFGFNVNISKQMKSLASQLGVHVRQHNVIYKLLAELKDELSNKLPPNEEETLIGEAVVQQIFTLTGSRRAVVGGCRVKKGNLVHNSLYRVIRYGDIIYEGKLSAMKRGLDDITQAKRETECGLSFDKFSDIQVGDLIQSYNLSEVKQRIDWEWGF